MRKASLVVASLMLAACGSSSSPNGGASNGASKRDAMVTFAKCMRANGVPNFPDPGSNGHGGLEIQQSQRAGSGAALSINGVGVSSPAFQKAMQTCHSKLPNGGHPPPLSAARKAAMLRFSQCMRAHGLTNFPDPSFAADGRAQLKLTPGSSMDPTSPAFQRAQAACAKYQGGDFRVKAP